MNALFRSFNGLHRGVRLLIALLPAAGLFFWNSAHHAGPAISFLLSWIVFSSIVLFFSWVTILQNNPRDAAIAAEEQDNSRLITFLFIVICAFISLFAIIALLQDLPHYSKNGLTRHILLSVVAVGCSWVLIHTLFTLRYAHVYFRSSNVHDPACKGHGLSFPDANEHPDLLDFAYFSFVLGMTFQVSDVSVTSRRMRRLVLVHSLLSFVFNTVIVAFTINILSGIIGK